MTYSLFIQNVVVLGTSMWNLLHPIELVFNMLSHVLIDIF
jgi:hypothetical protein